MLLSLVLKGLLGIIYVFESIYFGKVLDATLTTLKNVKSTILIIIIITLSEYGIEIINTYALSRNVESGLYNLRNSLSKKICHLKFQLFNEKSTGDILSRTMGDLNGVGTFWSETFIDMYQSLFTFFTGLVVCLSISVKLTIVGFIFIPISSYIAYKNSKNIEKSTYSSREALGKINELAYDILTGIMTLKSFTLEHIMKKKFYKVSSNYIETEKKLGKDTFKISILATSISYIPEIVVTLVAGTMALNKVLTSGEYLTFAFTFGMVSGVLYRSQNYLIQVRSAEAMAIRVLEIYDFEEENLGKVEESTLKNEVMISIRNLGFSYANNKVLDHINMDIRKYEKIAIVGESGSGKSTLLNILSGMYEPQEGNVSIAGFNLNEENISSIRNKIGLVSQETFLFPKSIYDNLLYGNKNATKEQVIKAAKRADIHDFITTLPKKYDTFVGEKGVYLSGGQRQRIAIACAFLRNPEILILDEPTSALDAETERNIQKSLDELIKDKTAIIVAHRLVTIKNADIIYVLNKGKIVEKGSHDELVNNKGYYYNLYKKL
nr:ABC transporter ATP-binding protein [uncultured Clostridium sp.]